MECRTLDDIFSTSAPTYIKMDIEGAEPDAFQRKPADYPTPQPRLAVRVSRT